MNINEEFTSKYLKSSDLNGKTVRVKIRDVVIESVGQTQDRKIVAYFVGKDRGMIINRTNAMAIAEVWGAMTEQWIGGELELYTMRVPYQGKLTDGLRVRPLAATKHPQTTFAPNARDQARAEARLEDDREEDCDPF